MPKTNTMNFAALVPKVALAPNDVSIPQRAKNFPSRLCPRSGITQPNRVATTAGQRGAAVAYVDPITNSHVAMLQAMAVMVWLKPV